MSVRMHLFCDDVGTYKLGEWHLIVVRVPEHEPPSFSPPSPDATWILHLSHRNRSGLLWSGKAMLLHEVLARRDGPGHECEFCPELGGTR